MEFMTLGNICSLFNSLKDNNLKKQIARHYKCGLGIFLNYLETIRVIRNTCAHGGCIYNISLAKSIKSSPQVPISGDERHNIRGVIRVISFMIGIISENRKMTSIARLRRYSITPETVLQMISSPYVRDSQ